MKMGGIIVGLFDFLKKKPQPQVTITTHEPTREELTAQWETESHQKATERVRNFQKDEAGLYPHEILMIHYAPSYKVNGNKFPQFWKYEYAVDDPSALLKSLVKKGFIREATARESLGQLKVSELKSILSELGLTTTGKKDELLKRIEESASEKYLTSRVLDRRYALTDAGNKELQVNQYVPYMHSHKYYDISMTRMCLLVNKHPDMSYRDLIWGEFNRLSGEYIQKGNIGLYRNVRYNMFQFLMEEKRYSSAFESLAMAFFYDLNGDASPFIAPALINNFRDLERKLDYTDKQTIDILSRIFSGIYTPKRNYTNDEVIRIIVAYCSGNDEIAERIFNHKMHRAHK